MTPFWIQHQAELYRFLHTRTGDDDLAADLLQELFLKARAAADHFCQMHNPRAWLYTCARNLLLDIHKSAKPLLPLDESMPAPEENPTAITQLAACLPEVLQQLSEEERELIELCDIHQRSQKQVAADKALSLTAVKSRLLRARRRLKQQMIATCTVEFDESAHICCYKKIR
ncbi:sigma-70 family RNA polymerase sigma factor [Serratia rubidaea]|uniref:Sigma-70 family RNA polymerase sigma factor n=2 Tax=Serratia rubidaea TaxID=61652 RepID=A0ABS0MF55_SERRU|nr:sigma-70 family RNA polymerase sigma factor [Serratia rubidaea]